jgi:hypothetical protein
VGEIAVYFLRCSCNIPDLWGFRAKLTRTDLAFAIRVDGGGDRGSQKGHFEAGFAATNCPDS